MTSFEKILLHALKEMYPSFPIEECVHYNAGTNNNIILKKLTELNELDCDDDEWFDYKPLEEWQRRGFEPIDYGAGVLLSVNGKKKLCYSKQMVIFIPKNNKTENESTPEVKVEVVIIEKIVEKIKIVEKPIIKRTIVEKPTIKEKIVEKPTIKEKIVYIDKPKQKTTKAVKQKDNSLSDIYKEKSEQNSNTLQRRAWINNDTGTLTKLLKFLGKM